MSTATQTISWPVLLSKIRKLGYTGDDCIDDVRAWIEKRYDAIADPDLAAVIDAWLSLPKPVKAGIVAMVKARERHTG